jgi:hypothetical protein
MAGLDVWLGERRVGALTYLGGDQSIFAFDDAYADAPDRPTSAWPLEALQGACCAVSARPERGYIPTSRTCCRKARFSITWLSAPE